MHNLFSREGGGVRHRTSDHSADQAGATQPLENLEPFNHVLSSSPSLELKGEIELGGRHYVRQQRLANILGVSPRTLARWGGRPPSTAYRRP